MRYELFSCGDRRASVTLGKSPQAIPKSAYRSIRSRPSVVEWLVLRGTIVATANFARPQRASVCPAAAAQGVVKGFGSDAPLRSACRVKDAALLQGDLTTAIAAKSIGNSPRPTLGQSCGDYIPSSNLSIIHWQTTRCVPDSTPPRWAGREVAEAPWQFVTGTACLIPVGRIELLALINAPAVTLGNIAGLSVGRLVKREANRDSGGGKCVSVRSFRTLADCGRRC